MSEYSPVPLVELANLIGEFVVSGTVMNVCTDAGKKLSHVDHLVANRAKEALKRAMVVLTDLENKFTTAPSVHTTENLF